MAQALQIAIFIALIALSAAATGYVLFYSRLEKARLANRRLEAVRNADADRQARRGRSERNEAALRRKSVKDARREMETRQNRADLRRPPLKLLLRQAGLSLTARQFHFASALAGLVAALAAFLAGAPHL